jgi:hypothetical protein
LRGAGGAGSSVRGGLIWATGGLAGGALTVER